jgi:hypothetical protein
VYVLPGFLWGIFDTLITPPPTPTGNDEAAATKSNGKVRRKGMPSGCRSLLPEGYVPPHPEHKVCVCVCVCLCVCVCVCVCVPHFLNAGTQVPTSMPTRAHTRAHTQIDRRADAHTHTQRLARKCVNF